MHVYKGFVLLQMTVTLLDIIKCGLVNEGDSVEFCFKQYYFTAKIIRGGLLSRCRMKKPNTNRYEDILTHVSSFSSLTAFTEACLQDILEEYYTRYSSWKRVSHCESKQSMGEIRDRCKLLNTKMKVDDISELYKEIFRLQEIICEMSEYMKEKGEFKQKWTIVTLKKEEKKKRPKKKKRKIQDTQAHASIQDMMLRDNFTLSGCKH